MGLEDPMRRWPELQRRKGVEEGWLRVQGGRPSHIHSPISCRCFPAGACLVVTIHLYRVDAPCRYMPIVPTVLINGAEGIGTGWSTSVSSGVHVIEHMGMAFEMWTRIAHVTDPWACAFAT